MSDNRVPPSRPPPGTASSAPPPTAPTAPGTAAAATSFTTTTTSSLAPNAASSSSSAPTPAAGTSNTSKAPVRPNVYVPPPKIPPRAPRYRARMPYEPLPPKITFTDRLHRATVWGCLALTGWGLFMLGHAVTIKVARRYGIELNPNNPDILRAKAMQQAAEEQAAARAAGVEFNPLGSPVEAGSIPAPSAPYPDLDPEPVREV